MKTKTSELTGVALDWAVAKCEGLLGPDGICFSDEYCDSLGHKVARSLSGRRSTSDCMETPTSNTVLLYG